MLPVYGTPASTTGYQIIATGSSCPVMSPNLWIGGTEPICSLSANPFAGIGTAVASSLNLNTISQVTVEAAAGPGYTGGR